MAGRRAQQRTAGMPFVPPHRDAITLLTRRPAQSKTEEGRRAAYFERRRRELADAACQRPGDADEAVGPEPLHGEEPLCEGGRAPPLQHGNAEDEEESYDVLQLRFLVELAHAPAAHLEPAAQQLGSAGCLTLGAPEAPAQPAPSHMLLLEGGGASDHAGSLGVVGDEASPLQPLLAASMQQPTWRQQPALPPRAAARHVTPPPRKPAGAHDLRIFPSASFGHLDIGPEASAGLPEPMVTMPFVPAAPGADAQFTTPAASPRGAAASPARESSAWLVAAADAGAVAIAAGQGFRTPPRVAWAGSDDEAEAAQEAQLDATVSLLLEHGDAPGDDHQTDFAAFAAQRRASLRLGDIVADAGFQRRGDGGLLHADHGGGAYDAEYDAVRMQHSYAQHMGASWPMTVTTEERLEVRFYPAQHDDLARVAEHRPATSCRITECDDSEDDDGLSDLGMLLAQRGPKRDVVGSEAARKRSFHMPAALLGGAADSQPLEGSPAQQAAEQAAEAACVPSQLLSPELMSPALLTTTAAGSGGGGDDAGAWAAAARFAQELTVGPDVAAAPEQAPAAAEHAAADHAQPGCALAAPEAPANAAAAPDVVPPAAARTTRGVRQLRAALAAQRGEDEEQQQEDAAEYTAQLESAVLQLLLCKAAAQQFGDDGAAGFGWLRTGNDELISSLAAPQPAVARC